MSRRSARLESIGYYGDDGLPVISYRETIYRVFRRQRNRRRSQPGTSETLRRSWDLSVNWKSLRFFLIILPLCFVLQTLSNMSPPSEPSDYPATPITVDQNTRYEELLKQLREQQEELLWLRKKINQLLPVADMLPNFALESLGACISKSSEPYMTEVKGLNFFGRQVQRIAVTPRVVIQGQTRLVPGQCWAFGGGQGHLSIALAYQAAISHVTLGHISKNLSPSGSISSAPREFSVYGRKNLDDENIHLGTFLYDQEGDSLQTFKLPDHKKDVFSHVTLQINSNWGNAEYTCLYSFRVHGKLAD